MLTASSEDRRTYKGLSAYFQLNQSLLVNKELTGIKSTEME